MRYNLVMKKYLLAGLVLFCMLAMLAAPAKLVLSQAVQDFSLLDFSADYYLDRTDQRVPGLRVQEQITAEFPSYDQNHGLERAIPNSYRDQPIDLRIASVTNQAGQALPYHTYFNKGNLVLRIGNAQTYVHGQQKYVITYTLKNVILFNQDHDEFYWDINGDDWPQATAHVTARIHLPTELAQDLQPEQHCFTGSRGSHQTNCSLERQTVGDETVILAEATNLGPRQTLTTVIGFNKGVFMVDKAARRSFIIKFSLALGLGIVPLLVTIISLIRRWRREGRDPTGRQVIIPQYTPPAGLNVLTSDVILHEKLRTQAISALIIELAIRGYIALYEVQKSKLLGLGKQTDYELELTKNPETNLKTEEKSVINMLFGTTASAGNRVQLAALSQKLYQDVSRLNKTVCQDLAEQHYFHHSPIKIRNRYYLRGCLLAMTSLFCLPLIGWLGGLAILPFMCLALTGIITIIVAPTMPARTINGVAAREHLLGLRDYIKLAEADRLKFLQSPEGVRQYGDPNNPAAKVRLFEKLLPYAMLFGLEKDWGNQFKDIYKQSPNWYHGNWTSFSAGYLAGSLSGFAAASQTSFAPPSSSGSSGFGGGGFSGGGGGGGGGGGW